MDVIHADMTLMISTSTPHRSPNQLPKPEADIAWQQLLPVLGDPHQVEIDVELRMAVRR